MLEAQSAVRTVIEAGMIEELDAFIGVGWGACSPKRKGYRNGSYSRDLVTSTGSKQMELGPNYRVKPVPDFFAEVKALLGEAAVA